MLQVCRFTLPPEHKHNLRSTAAGKVTHCQVALALLGLRVPSFMYFPITSYLNTSPYFFENVYCKYGLEIGDFTEKTSLLFSAVYLFLVLTLTSPLLMPLPYLLVFQLGCYKTAWHRQADIQHVCMHHIERKLHSSFPAPTTLPQTCPQGSACLN